MRGFIGGVVPHRAICTVLMWPLGPHPQEEDDGDGMGDFAADIGGKDDY